MEARRLLQLIKPRRTCVAVIGKGCHQAKPWNCFDQEVLSFAVSLGREDTDARCIALWPRQRGHQSRPEHIAYDCNDRYRLCRLLEDANCFIPDSCDEIDPCVYQLSRVLRDQIDVLPKRAKFDREVLPFSEPAATQSVEKRYVYRRIARNRRQDAKAIGPPWLLSHRSERPYDTRAHKRDKLAPPHSAPPSTTKPVGRGA
jgi:hypothetical protein